MVRPQVSVTVMGHSARYDAALALAARLEAGLCLDDGRRGENANGDWAWREHEPDAQWHLVLQDDAQPVDNLLDHLAAALEHAPRTAVSLYVGTGRPKQPAVEAAVHTATSLGAAWLEHPTLLWGVAVAMPTDHIAPFLTWARTNHLPYDKRIGAYWQRARIPVRYTWPSLVDHADGPTLVKHPWGPPTGPRRAWRIGTPDTWDTPVVRI